MGKSRKDNWIRKTSERLENETVESSTFVVEDQTFHIVEPVVDKDWQGETWGLFWSDYEGKVSRSANIVWIKDVKFLL